MPITQSFDPVTPEIISPSQTVEPSPGFPETIIVTFQPHTIAAVEQELGASPVATIQLEETHDQDRATTPGNVYSFQYAGQTLGTYLSPVGAPGAAATLEMAIAHGARKFVVFGTCGALGSKPATGIIVPTAAYRDEGTSYHYARSSDYITVTTADQTARILTDLGIDHTCGKVWTTDAFFRETQGNMAKRVAQGCLAVDMETSALAAVSQFRGVAVHHFLHTADTLSTDGWDSGLLGVLPAEPRARYFTIAAEIAVRL